MSDPTVPISPTSLPPISDVYFRRLFIPIVISIVVIVFVFVMISVPSSISDSQTFIGGGLNTFSNLSTLKKLLS